MFENFWLVGDSGRQYFKLSIYAIRPKLLRRGLGLEKNYYIKSYSNAVSYFELEMRHEF